MKQQGWSGSYQYFEGYTAGNQMVSFTARPESGETVKEMLASCVRSVYFPTTKSLTHGGKGLATRYDIEQHVYGGGDGECGGGYIEVLDVKDAPEDRCRYIVHQYSYMSHSGLSSHVFSEWASLADAISARKSAGQHTLESCKELPGFIRFVDCGELTPWFYALGNEMLLGDFAVHAGFEDHPVYRLGKKFIITYENGTVRVATCMGSRQYSYKEERGGLRGGREEKFHWVVMFSDGSNLHLDTDDVDSGRQFFGNTKKTIQALPDGQVWQVDLLMQFWSLISGKKLGGTIKFEDGSSLVMKFQPKGKTPPSAPGRYLLRVTRQGGEIEEGWVDYDPDKNKFKTVVEMVLKATPKVDPDNRYVKVEVKKRDGDVSKKWLGVWHKALS